MYKFLLSAFAAMSIHAADFPNPTDMPVNPRFPDPLVMMSGEMISSKEGWLTKRVPELRALFQHYMYGAQPAPRKVTGTVLREDKNALGGKAILREIAVHMGLEQPVHLLLVIPKKQPAPCFLGLNFLGSYAVLDDPKIQMPKGWVYETYAGAPDNRAAEAGRGREKDAWSMEQSIDRGYAVATFYNGDVVTDKLDIALPALAKLRAPR
jgi:hypothetical protein